MFAEKDYEIAAKILHQEGIIYADDNRFDCFHNSIEYTAQLLEILREKLAKHDSSYGSDEEDQSHLLSLEEPNANGHWLHAIYTDMYEPREALELVRDRKTP